VHFKPSRKNQKKTFLPLPSKPVRLKIRYLGAHFLLLTFFDKIIF
jgi:hypothetical protein